MPRHRAVVSSAPRGEGLEWTYVHPERGPKIDATKRAYDDGQRRMSGYQVLITAAVANAERVEGVALEGPFPNDQAEELAYLNRTAPGDYSDVESARQRLITLFHSHKNRLSHPKRTERAVERVRPLALEGQFLQAHYAFDNGVLSPHSSSHRANDGGLERARLIQWQGQWRRVDAIASALHQQHPESFRLLKGVLRSGEEKAF